MRLLWEYPIGDNTEEGGTDFLSNCLMRDVFDLGNSVAFVHSAFLNGKPGVSFPGKKTTNFVVSDEVDKQSGSHRKKMFLVPPGVYLPHPQSWNCVFENGALLLNTGYYAYQTSFDKPEDEWFTKIMNLSGDEITVEADAPPAIAKEHAESAVHYFGEYEVAMTSLMRMTCQRDGDEVWSLRLTAYLYTFPEERGGTLYFGTAGNGGHFYGIRLTDGEVLCDVNTGGSAQYAWFGERVCLKNKTGDLLLHDPRSGEQVQLKLKHALGDYSPMFVEGNRLYTSLYHKSKPITYAACIELA